MKHLLFLTALISCQFANSQVIFSEDFSNLNGTLPAGWTVINVDGLTPNANVAQFNSAWIIAQDFDNIVDTVAMSTSWYTPAGTANDWLITPAIPLSTNNVLEWEAEAQDATYPDGYELRISTTTPTVAGFNANPALFTIPAENGAVWTQRSVNLQNAGYSNQSVYLAWRNNSTDQFVLMVDDISVYVQASFDAAISDNTSYEYTISPLGHVAPIGSAGVITNAGGGTITNATMSVDIFDGSLNNVYSATSLPVASIASGASQAVSVPGFTPTVADLYTVNLGVSITETDGNIANDVFTYTVLVDDSVYARDDSNASGTLGIGATIGGQLGQAFDVLTTDDITSVSFYLANTAGLLAGQTITADVYATDVTGTPTTVLASTDPLVMDTTTNTLWTLPIVGGGYTLTPGEYVVVVNESDSNLTLGTSTNIFTAGKTWVDWPTNPQGTWTNSEFFNFNIAYVLRANFGPFCAPTASTVTDNSCNTYTWAQNGATYTTSGMYYDTLTNAQGCDSIITLDLTINIDAASSQTASSCSDYIWAADGQTYTTSGTYTASLQTVAGCDSVVTLNLTIGSIDNTTSTNVYTITASQSNATYQWIDCTNGNAPITGETNQSFTATANGDYAVIITEGSCTDTSACVTISTIGLDELNLSNEIEVFPNPASGAYNIVINGLPAGTSELTITDASGKIIETKQLTLSSGENTVPMSANQLEGGIYFVTVTTENNTFTERIAVIHE